MTCPKCRGYTVTERDMHGTVTACINCGWTQDIGAISQEQAQREMATQIRQRPPVVNGIRLRGRQYIDRRYQ